ncbi:hypothetical protein like AT3G11590 [Hibiscus trionum]|uniref:Uncharacterized protein n=1 Tax=Hibiscus trionum TaxID=183268 RepID=A0A9W7I508_HIBTR|nr:hypothetical protein like AT3G11590 [Hibiscus trionum]
MSWQQHHGKIRKRGCSSSSSSPLIQNYRFKRAVLVGKKAGSTTPVPSWITVAAKPPSLAMATAEFPTKGSPKIVAQTKEGSVSARKLAATLWEINTIPFSEKMNGGRVKSQRRRSSVVSQNLQVPVGNGGFMEIEARSRGKKHGGCIIGTRTRLKDVGNGLATSKELLEVLNRVCRLEDGHSSSMSLVSALHVELDRARIHVDQLIREQRSNRNGIELLMRHFAEEKAAWKRKERQRIGDAIACIAEELEVEKKLRRQTERLNKKLGKELADTAATLSKAMKALESEKRAKEILEQVCDELAQGIGEDRATAEELKRESAKVKEELEKEREMLQFADILREERVQMKLSEAKYHFEEKNAVVEKLRNELETYLGTKLDEENGDGSPNLQRIKELEAYLKKINFGSFQMVEKVADKVDVMDGEECEAEDSADSDLHSIELNMDNNDMSYKWTYACGNYAEGGSKKIPIEKDNKGRKSLSEMISWGSICLERGSSNCKDQDFGLERYRSVKSLRDHILSSNKIAPIQSFPSPTRQWSQSMHFEEAGGGTGSPVSKLVGTISEGRTSAS